MRGSGCSGAYLRGAAEWGSRLVFDLHALLCLWGLSVVVVVFRLEYFSLFRVITLNSEKKHPSRRTTTTASVSPQIFPKARFLLLDSRFSSPTSLVLPFDLEINCDHLQISQAAA